jgi:hypothetical protein
MTDRICSSAHHGVGGIRKQGKNIQSTGQRDKGGRYFNPFAIKMLCDQVSE